MLRVISYLSSVMVPKSTACMLPKFSRRNLWVGFACALLCFLILGSLSGEVGLDSPVEEVVRLHHHLRRQLSQAAAPHFASDQLVRTHRTTSLDECVDKPALTKVAMRGTEYWVIYNYIKASRQFKCNQTVTITSHTEIPYLHNLEPLLQRYITHLPLFL